MSAKKKGRKPGPTAMTAEQIRWVQGLRQSSAARPQGKRPTRAAQKKAAMSGW